MSNEGIESPSVSFCSCTFLDLIDDLPFLLNDNVLILLLPRHFRLEKTGK